MTGYESKKAMAQDKITDEQGRPMTYWGGKAQPAQDLSEQGRNRSAVLGNNVEAMMDAGLPFLKALETTLKVYDHDVPKLGCVNHDCDKCKAQPAQEPSYWLGYGLQAHTEKPFNDATPLYTAPPQRPWVGLTAKEAAECWTTSATQTWKNFEAKLKEKNT